jgi:hypothetical protein
MKHMMEEDSNLAGHTTTLGGLHFGDEPWETRLPLACHSLITTFNAAIQQCTHIGDSPVLANGNVAQDSLADISHPAFAP